MKKFISFKYGIFILHIIVYFLKIVNGSNSIKELGEKQVDKNVRTYQGIMGSPGQDYPTLRSIPRTKFSCKGQKFGYYADLETRCQVFHVCEDGHKTSFICPNGTIFQQSNLICDWWYRVDCDNAPKQYEQSAQLLEQERVRRKQSKESLNNQNQVGHKQKYAISERRSSSGSSVEPEPKAVREQQLSTLAHLEQSTLTSIRSYRRRVSVPTRKINANDYLTRDESQQAMESKSFLDAQTDRAIFGIYSPTVPLVRNNPEFRSTNGPTYLPYVPSPQPNRTESTTAKANVSETIPSTSDIVYGSLKMPERNPSISSASLLLSVAQHLASERDKINVDIDSASIDKDFVTNDVNTTLPPLLTNYTIKDFYNLFSRATEINSVDTITPKPITTTVKIDFQPAFNANNQQYQNGKPKIRYLAQVFADALSSYFYDPLEFRKNLENIRPTEPTFTKATTIKPMKNKKEDQVVAREKDEVLEYSDIETTTTTTKRPQTKKGSTAKSITVATTKSVSMSTSRSTTERPTTIRPKIKLLKSTVPANFQKQQTSPNHLALNINNDLNANLVSESLFLPNGGYDDFNNNDDDIDNDDINNDDSNEDSDLDTKNTASYFGYGAERTFENRSTTSASIGNLWRTSQNISPLTLNYKLEDELPKVEKKSRSDEILRIKLGVPLSQFSSTLPIASVHTSTATSVATLSTMTTTTTTTPATTTAEIPDTEHNLNSIDHLLDASEFDLAKSQAKQIFGDLTRNEQSRLMEKMHEAEHNSTIRKLVLLLINTCNENDLYKEYGRNRTSQNIRTSILNMLLDFPSEQIRSHLMSNKPNDTVSRTSDGRSISAINALNKRRNISNKNYSSVLKTSKNHEIHAIVRNSDQKLTEREIDENTRALELLKSLYSLAARWV